MEGAEAIISLIRDGGTLALFVLFLLSLAKGYIVLGREYEDAKAESRFWRQVAMKNLKLLEVSTDVLEAGRERREWD